MRGRREGEGGGGERKGEGKGGCSTLASNWALDLAHLVAMAT